MSLAVGLALADSYHTPNLLFTYADRQRLSKRTTITRAVRVMIVVLLVVLVCSTMALRYYLGIREGYGERLRQTVAVGAQTFDKQHIMQLSDQAVSRQLTTRGLAEAYFAPAVIAEIASLTPPAISLLEIQVDFAASARLAVPDGLTRPLPAKTARDRKAAAAADKADPAGQPDTVHIEGVVVGTRERMDALLAEYVFRLQHSPFFASPQLLERRLENVDPTYVTFGEERTDHLLFFKVEAALRSQAPKAKEEKPKE